LAISISLSFPPERLAGFVSNLRPAFSHILQLALAHDGELTPDAAALPPRQDGRDNSPADGKC
jgi:hypothetical protein